MLSVENFLALCPEFKSAPLDLIRLTLAQTWLRIDVTVWGTLADEGHKYSTGHALSVSPFGRNAKLGTTGKDGFTYYEREYNKLVRLVGRGIMVL